MSAGVPTLVNPIALKDAPEPIALFVEQQLSRIGLLEASQVNGKIGGNSIEALVQFKEAAFLEFPERVGQTTLNALAKAEEKHKVSEQSLSIPTKVLTTTGTKTGRSATLPIVGLVYENEEIVEGGRLTWGEMLRGFTRMPAGSATFGSEEQIVRRILHLAEVFRVTRDKFDAPIGVNSSYRPYYLKIGASRSRHRYGDALDMRPMNGSWQKLIDCIRANPDVKGLGLGKHLGFYHMDCRPTEDRVIFTY